ncbi:MAG TPA: hypothetical protein VEU30_12340 [Thermoanaerobaculia bacterium]|nr:hypothetical protein [Thermoanaerobaculia bacterium]
MAKMTVHMVGLMYFHVCEDNVCEGVPRQVLLPDATAGDPAHHLPPHHASIYVEEARLDGTFDWPWTVIIHGIPVPGMKPVKMYEFQVGSALTELTFPDDGGGGMTMVDLDKALVRIRDVDPKFQPDLSGEGSVARVLVRSGKLQAFTFHGVNPVQWSMETQSATLEIKARHENGMEGTISVKPDNGARGAEVVLANTPALFSPPVVGHGHQPDHEHDHFSIYNNIRMNGASNDVRLPPHRNTLPNAHLFFKALNPAVLMNSCTGICCAS